jgi:acyl-CoA thioesterase FadM
MDARLLVLLGSLVAATAGFAAECVTDARGRTVCGNRQETVAVNPNTGKVTSAQRRPGGVTTTQSDTGTKTAVNTRTGNAAVAQTNANGVTTTETRRGGQAKTKNGVGVAQGPDGTVCAKGRNTQGCTHR